MEKIYSLKTIKDALVSRNETVAIWGAYQFLIHYPDKVEKEIHNFIDSPFIEIQEAGLSKISELKLDQHFKDAVKIFRESEGQLKYAAAYCLSVFPNDFSIGLLQKWYRQLVMSEQSTRIELEVAVDSFLNIDKKRHIPIVLQDLMSYRKDLIKSTVLIGSLLLFCEEKEEIERIIDHYFIIRDLFSDVELTFQFINFFGKMEIYEWISSKLLSGYSLNSILKQCLNMFGINVNILDQQLWHDVDRSLKSFFETHSDIPKKYGEFIEGVYKIIKNIKDVIPLEDYHRQLWVVEKFHDKKEQFGNTVIKINKLESFYLLSIPIYLIVSKYVKQWLENPDENLHHIANYYHSSLLTQENQERILNLFFPEAPIWTGKQLKITKKEFSLSIEKSKSEVLWGLFQGKFLGYDIPWSSFFPNPNYSKYLVDVLFQIYFENFKYYIDKKDVIAVDYALKLFQLHPQKKIIGLLWKNFDYLTETHYEMLYQTIEYLPDESFLELLIDCDQPMDDQKAELLLFLSQVLKIEIPDSLKKDILSEGFIKRKSGLVMSARLRCDHCGIVSSYNLDKVYIDESVIYYMENFLTESVWIPNDIYCSDCNSIIPFRLDEIQLEELKNQVRVERSHKFNEIGTVKGSSHKIYFIDFPRYLEKSYNPIDFDKLVMKMSSGGIISNGELQELKMKQARIKKSLEKWDEIIDILEDVKPSKKNKVEWNFLMGLANYRLSGYVDSRQYFGYIDKNYVDGKNSTALSYFVEQSRYFLETMDSYDSKKARLKLVNKNS
ncbi:MAG: hypothetical protein OEY59_00745 [Deltaproteobacteria bacterium]|nr:hypothetical protein [Deltaproteobacteria bacterium]